ncbi:hypothetical protein DW757_15750 [Clostridium sp. AM29-11AC]|nr:hypothetical protein DW757_15750 [Clostridium sp. AM29-11AC]
MPAAVFAEITGSQLLYHLLRIWQPPAEFSARLSAVNAETGMRKYNDCFTVIIPYPSDMLFFPPLPPVFLIFPDVL